MKIKRLRRLSDTGGLRGPDVADTATPMMEVVGDPIQVWAMQFCNRWVFLPHQRAAALDELKELIREAQKTSVKRKTV